MNIIGINQNSPSFGMIIVPRYSKKGGGLINNGDEISTFLKDLFESKLIQDGVRIDKLQGCQIESRVPSDIIMTEEGTMQNIVIKRLNDMGAQEVTTISEGEAGIEITKPNKFKLF